ncbi:hypothetical protein TNCT_380371 [Trichonephila clavata]|uniref:Uncharacterized protein n=1 Tax=Trichonephila clavata TaxID=2740835 RepID=A0A8X6M110_TRICU|nr:hypothetical protein TNCT_380371 [Trichonephila clavata]
MVLPRPVHLVYAVGQRNVRSATHDIYRPVEEFKKELCIPRPYVLMHAEWSYHDPPALFLRWGSVIFLPPRHDIDRPVEEFRTELCIHRPCVLMVLPRNVRPVYAVG